MNALFSWKSNRHWLIPVLVLAGLNALYFAPVVFQNKSIPQDDILMGLAKGKEIVDYREATGEEPLWTNSMFSGMPTFQVSTLYPNNVLGYFQTAISTVLGLDSGIYIVATLMIGFFFLLRGEKVEPGLAVVGALAFGFSAFFIISLAAGHNAKIRTAAYMAPLLLGVLLTLRGRLALGFALTALFTGMSIHANHFQITFYTALPILAMVVAFGVHAFRQGTGIQWGKHIAILALAAVVGIGPNIGNLWSSYAYTKASMRGGHSDLTPEAPADGTPAAQKAPSAGLDFDYAMSWSYGISETLNLFIPNLMGGGAKQSYKDTETYTFVEGALRQQGYSGKVLEANSNQLVGSRMYWGDQSLVNGAYYVGAVVFFLFVLGLLVVRGPARDWAIAALAISALLAWGKNAETLNRLVFEYLPLYNKFRVPSMALVVAFLVVPYLGFAGLQTWLNRSTDREWMKKKLLLALYITGGLSLLIAVFGPAFLSLESPRDAGFGQEGFDLNMLRSDRESLLRSSAFSTLFFVVATAGLLWAQMLGKLKPMYLVVGLGALVLVDQWRFDRDQLGSEEFVSNRDFQAAFAPSPADMLIQKDTDPHYRVFNTSAGLTSDSYTSYHHKSVGGYHGAKLARYQDLIDRQLSKGNFAVYNMLNTKWFIVKDNANQPIAQPNLAACGHGWFPSEVRRVAGPDAAMAALTDFDPLKTAIVDAQDIPETTALPTAGDSAAAIALSQYDPKTMTYAVRGCTSDRLAVFSEIFYDVPGQKWIAEADGKEIPVMRVNYVLRAAVLPAGTQEVVFRFEPTTYTSGEQIDLGFSVLLVLALAGAFWQELRKRKGATAV
jgi:hypothetical protein